MFTPSVVTTKLIVPPSFTLVADGVTSYIGTLELCSNAPPRPLTVNALPQ